MKISPMNPYLGSSSTQTYEKVLKGNFPKETFQVTIPKWQLHKCAIFQRLS